MCIYSTLIKIHAYIAERVQVLLTVSCVLWGMGALKIEESAYFRHSPHKKEEAHVRFFALFYEKDYSEIPEFNAK